MTQEPSVFLSYSLSDRARARDLYRLLADADIAVWFDEVSSVPGTRWDVELSHAIANSTVVLILVGERPSVERQRAELRSALDRASVDPRFRIIPVLLPGATIGNLPREFWKYQFIDLRDISDEDLKLRRIAAALASDPRTGVLAEPEEIGDRLRDAGDFSGAIQLYKRSLELVSASLDSDDPGIARIQRKLGVAHLGAGDFDAAEHYFRIALAIDERLSHGRDHPSVSADLSNLATLYQYRGDFVTAKELQIAALEMSRRALGERHPDTLTAINNLAGTLGGMGQFSEAHVLQEYVLQTRIATLGKEHPDTITALSNLAATLGDMRDLSRARDLQKWILEVRVRQLGEEHPDTLTSMNNLASTLAALGDLNTARGLQEHLLKLSLRLFGEDHPSTLTAMNNLASVLRAMGDLRAARVLLEQTLVAYRRTLGSAHPDTASVLSNLASLIRREGDTLDALALFQEAAWLLEKSLGTDHPSTKKIRNEISSIERAAKS